MEIGYIQRTVDSDLLAWKGERGRKPLLVRGARQVGKSSSVRNLARHFEHFLEVNFERDSDTHVLFDGNLRVREICEKLSALYKTPVVPGKTLVFFDEIQSCPRAVSSLRFFYEDYPELHVTAAGSLIEFALQTLPSFGVGRIRSLFMHPLSYKEFLSACGEQALWDTVCEASPEKPLPEPFHKKCLEYLRVFLIIGGMPAVAARYAESGKILDSQNILNDLMTSYKSDFSKYKKRVLDLQISAVFDAAVSQSGGRFNHAKVEQLSYRKVKESLDLLLMAGLLIPVTHSSANALPLGGEANPKKQKLILLDTGIFQRLSGLEFSDILLKGDISLINKGAIAEQFVGLELLKASSCYSPESLYFWSREKSGSSAEIDYVARVKSGIVPIEVKSGSTGKMQSMHLFLKEKGAEYGVRTSLENFSTYKNIRVYPLYAIGNVISAPNAPCL